MLLFRVRPDFPKFSRFRIDISPWGHVDEISIPALRAGMLISSE
jgi:hypothetical protein